MWFFMNTCYVLSFLTFFLLIVAYAQSFFNFFVFRADHITFMILTSIIYLLTETLVIFFFVGTGVSIKEYTLDHHLVADFHKRSISIKRRVYPPQLLNMLFMIILFVMVGAVDTLRIPKWTYHLMFTFCLWHFIKIKINEHFCFRDNTDIILDMSGISRKS